MALRVATITTPNGSILNVHDIWDYARSSEAKLNFNRTLTVERVGDGDRAFNSEIAFNVRNVTTLPDADVFIPGLWYATAAHTPRSGLITDLGQHDFILREDRMTLPLVSVRDRASGTTLTLEHNDPDGTTIAADDDVNPVIDERLRFGALGIRRDDAGLELVFRFPGSEGEQTSIHGYKPDLRTAERFHPMTVGATQTYSLTLRLTHANTFAEQMRDAWRTAVGRAKPQPVPFDADKVYAASVDVLDHYAYTKNGVGGDVSGIPFGVSLPDGLVKDTSLQMGFVGQQLPCASYLIDEGIRTRRPELRAKGERIVDFWCRNSLSPAGVPRTWFDLTPQPHWRDYPTFLRVATDGTSGMLRAWQIERTAGTDKPEWLAFCRSVGDWLIRIQNADGSFHRAWNFDGTPRDRSLTSTLHPVRLLVDLSCATGDPTYREAALRAATFALTANADGATYVGGTPDNPDVVDKEAGWIAFDSYLALYDVTRDQRWLTAATDAATFTETWIYQWNVPLPADSTKIGVPRVATFVGTNLIATGHSGVDVFLACASFSYARLALYTGDEHFSDVARLLQHNSAQFVDVDGSLGYAHPGLLVEAFTLSVNRGHSVRLWLPWLSSAILEPMARTREAFGVLDVDAIKTLDPTERDRRHHAWARTRGFGLP